jgi:hypothetical protein
MDQSRERVLRALAACEWMYETEIAREAGIPATDCLHTVADLRTEGSIESRLLDPDGEGRRYRMYLLTEVGRALLVALAWVVEVTLHDQDAGRLGVDVDVLDGTVLSSSVDRTPSGTTQVQVTFRVMDADGAAAERVVAERLQANGIRVHASAHRPPENS